MKDREEVHYNMSRIRGKDTSIEIILRKALKKEGYTYRKNVKKLPGCPDIVLCQISYCHLLRWRLLPWI